jgi:tyrosinase
MTRTRADVWAATNAEGDWPAALVGYERAVGLLRALDPPEGRPVNPLGWRFLAAIHGIAGANNQPDVSNPLWCTCQHGSWFFLPWHRMYLAAFELIVQQVLADDEWSLPYWYAIDPDDPGTSVLPPAFRDTTRNNELFTERRSIPANSGAPLPDLSASVLQALDADVFSSPDGLSSFGSGERATPLFNGGEVGLVEDVPHGAVHVLVGNDFNQQGNVVRRGWMGSFFTAGLDPVFWLHHANIDRLWQVWLDLDPAHRNPTGDPAWFDTEFSFPAAGGGLVTWKVGDVLDTRGLGYQYESTAAPQGVGPPIPPVALVPEVGVAGGDMTQRLPPRVLGATADVALASADVVVVDLARPDDLGLAGDAAPGGGRMFLRIEGVTGTSGAAVYDVYLNVPAGDSPGDHPELRAGSFSTFGVAEMSQTNDIEGGAGRTSVLEITRVRDALAERGRWDPDRVRVSFIPVVPIAPDDAAAAQVESMAATPTDMHARRIAIVVS